MKPSTKTKKNIEDLPGKNRSERVFVGGQYDFMPTLRAIAQFVTDISYENKRLFPIIPLDYEIEEEETMDRDLEIVNRCGYAIFDLSDLGAQLVEMQEARQKANTIKSLLVYPVRDRVNEPLRGRRTVISFGLPHFGYMTFDELKGIVWRFLMDAPVEKDHAPRAIYDPILDRQIRRIRISLAQAHIDDSLKLTKKLLRQNPYKTSLDVWLQLALISCRNSDNKTCDNALKQAQKFSKDYKDKAEVWYYKGIIEGITPEDWKRAKINLLRAKKYNPGDGRILQLLGYAFWELNDKQGAIEATREALADCNLPDPVVAIHAINNLGYFLCEQV